MRINCHAHCFNFRTILTPASVEIIQRRLAGEIQPKFLADALAEAVGDALADLQAFDEERWLRALLERLRVRDGFQDLIPALPSEVPDGLREVIAGKLENLALGGLRRAVDSLIGLFRRSGDADKATLYDVIEFLRIASKRRIEDVARHQLRQLEPEDVVVALALDITAANADDTAQFTEQIDGTARAALTYPGRLLPFFGVHTARADHFARLERAILEQGFVGVKLYPSVGYAVDSPEMRRVYRYCLDKDLPLLMHCNKGGFYASEATIENANPAHWKAILPDFPGLRICFAHFGGGGNLTRADFPRGWEKTILELMDQFPGVYTDISFHTGPMDDPEGPYFDNLRSVIDHPTRGDRVLWGTDFWLVRTRLSERSHWRFFEEHLENRFDLIARRNPIRFLGLPDEAGNVGANIVRHVAVLADGLDSWEAPPPPWVDEVAARLGPALATKMAERAEEITPSASLRIPRFREWAQSLGTQALAANHAIEIEDGVEVDGSRLELAGLDVGLRADAKLSVTLIDDEDTADPDGVIAHGDTTPVALTAGTGDAERLPPAEAPTHIRYDPESAWLKYRADGTLRLEGQGSFGSTGLSIAADGGVTFADYRRHPRDQPAGEAIVQDLRRPRFALSLEDVLSLGPAEALLYRTHGALEAAVTVSWSDVLSFGLNRLAGLLGSTETIGLEVDVGAQISARVALVDDFDLVVSREPGSSQWPYRVTVKKARQKSVGLNAGLGLTVRWQDPDQIERLLGSLLQQGLGFAESTLRRLIDKAQADLSQSDQQILAKVGERLGVTPAKAKAELERLATDLRETIGEIAKAKIEVGFTYEYSRIETDAALLQVKLTERALAEQHRLLASGQLGDVLARADWDHDTRLELYLREKRIERKSSFGFSLGIGSWLRIGDQSQRKLLYVEQTARIADSERTRISYLGQRSYSGPSGSGSSGWKIDLAADMHEFVAGVPRLSAFRFGLSLTWSWTNRKLDDDLRSRAFDAAELWRATPTSKVTALDSLTALDGKRVDLTLQVVIPPKVLDRVLRRVPTQQGFADAERERMAAALAAAMPWSKKLPALVDVATREEIYAPLYEQMLASAAADPSFWKFVSADWARTADQHFRNLADPELRKQHGREGRAANKNDLFTFAGINRVNQTTAQDSERFLVEMTSLRQAVEGTAADGDPHTDFAEIFNGMQKFWKQSHHVRAVGRYLLSHVAALQMLDETARTLTVEGKEAGSEKAVVIAGA